MLGSRSLLQLYAKTIINLSHLGPANLRRSLGQHGGGRNGHDHRSDDQSSEHEGTDRLMLITHLTTTL